MARTPIVRTATGGHAVSTMQRLKKRDDSGFALILAIMSLMLLTFLGLTLAATTSTELQIATNFKYMMQAKYNAEAGLEAGKSILRALDWNSILPVPRPSGGGLLTWQNDPTTWTGPGTNPTPRYARNDKLGNPSRNFENQACDWSGNGQGFGVVLDEGSPDAPYQNVSTVLSQSLSTGSFTIWVRRNVKLTPPSGPTVQDDDSDNVLVLTAEGVAPPFQHANTSAGLGGRAVAVLEVMLTRSAATAPCGSRVGQTGGGPEGAGFGPCDPVTGAGIASGLGLGSATDTGVN